jgi:PAS domain-containing protein
MITNILKYVPVCNREGVLQNVILFSTRNQEAELRANLDTLQNTEEELRQTMEEIQATLEESDKRGRELEESKFLTEQIQAGIYATNNIAELDVNANVTDVNANFCKLVGLEKNTIVGNHLSMFVGDIGYRNAWNDLIKGKVHEAVEHITVEGEAVTNILKYVPVCNREGALQTVILFSTRNQEAQLRANLETLQNTEEELRQTMEEIQATLEESDKRGKELEESIFVTEQIRAGIYATNNVAQLDANGIAVDVNANFCKLVGLNKKAIVGNHLSMFVGDRGYRNAWNDLTKGRVHEAVEHLNIDGKMITNVLKYVPVCDSEGVLQSVLLLSFRQQDEQAAANSNEIGTWEVNIIQSDPTNPKNTYIWSDTLRKMLGYKDKTDFPDTLNSLTNKMHADDKESALAALAAHLLDKTGQTPYNMQYRLLKKDGEYGTFLAYAETERDKDGNAIKTTGTIKAI